MSRCWNSVSILLHICPSLCTFSEAGVQYTASFHLTKSYFFGHSKQDCGTFQNKRACDSVCHSNFLKIERNWATDVKILLTDSALSYKPLWFSSHSLVSMPLSVGLESPLCLTPTFIYGLLRLKSKHTPIKK